MSRSTPTNTDGGVVHAGVTAATPNKANHSGSGPYKKKGGANQASAAADGDHYAGPTFHHSPAPTKLPPPPFLSRSIGKSGGSTTASNLASASMSASNSTQGHLAHANTSYGSFPSSSGFPEYLTHSLSQSQSQSQMQSQSYPQFQAPPQHYYQEQQPQYSSYHELQPLVDHTRPPTQGSNLTNDSPLGFLFSAKDKEQSLRQLQSETLPPPLNYAADTYGSFANSQQQQHLYMQQNHQQQQPPPQHVSPLHDPYLGQYSAPQYGYQPSPPRHNQYIEPQHQQTSAGLSGLFSTNGPEAPPQTNSPFSPFSSQNGHYSQQHVMPSQQPQQQRQDAFDAFLSQIPPRDPHYSQYPANALPNLFNSTGSGQPPVQPVQQRPMYPLSDSRSSYDRPFTPTDQLLHSQGVAGARPTPPPSADASALMAFLGITPGNDHPSSTIPTPQQISTPAHTSTQQQDPPSANRAKGRFSPPASRPPEASSPAPLKPTPTSVPARKGWAPVDRPPAQRLQDTQAQQLAEPTAPVAPPIVLKEDSPARRPEGSHEKLFDAGLEHNNYSSDNSPSRPPRSGKKPSPDKRHSPDKKISQRHQNSDGSHNNTNSRRSNNKYNKQNGASPSTIMNDKDTRKATDMFQPRTILKRDPATAPAPAAASMNQSTPTPSVPETRPTVDAQPSKDTTAEASPGIIKSVEQGIKDLLKLG
ncbi:hypothetical protein PYCC9005_002188 [Savitreella phatthalungensis]